MPARRIPPIRRLPPIAPLLIGFALPTLAHFIGRWLGHPDWELPVIAGFLAGCFATAIYLLPSSSQLNKSLKASDELLARLHTESDILAAEHELLSDRIRTGRPH